MAPAKTDSRRTQKERSDESARRLLDATIELIGERGFATTSVADISERAGYSRAMVNARYGSKENLLVTLLESDFAAWVLPKPAGDETGLERALTHLDLYEQHARERPGLLRASLIVSYESTGPLANLADWARGGIDAYRTSIADALRTGQEDGSVRPDLDADQAARDLTTYIIGIGFQWALAPAAVDLSDDLPRIRGMVERDWDATGAV